MKPQLLVVDDEQEIRSLLQRHFRYLGYEVDVASDGVHALEQLALKPYHVVISDINMPRMGGINLLERVHTEYPMIRMIMITGYVTQENILACMRLGADSCVFKPLSDFKELELAVARSVDWIRHWWSILARLRSIKPENCA